MPALVSTSSNQAASGSATSVSVTAPTSIVSGNLLLAALHIPSSSGAGSSGANVSAAASSGWSVVGTSGSGTTNYTVIFTKTATGAEPGSYSFTWTGGSWAGCSILQYSGTTGLDGSVVFNNSGATLSSGSGLGGTTITPSTTGDQLIAVFGAWGNTPTPSSSSGTLTLRANDSFDFGFVYDEALLSTSSVTVSWSWTGTQAFCAATLLLAPTAAPYVPPGIRSFVPQIRASSWRKRLAGLVSPDEKLVVPRFA